MVEPRDAVAVDADVAQVLVRGEDVLAYEPREAGRGARVTRGAEREQHDGALTDDAADVDVRAARGAGRAEPAANRRIP